MLLHAWSPDSTSQRWGADAEHKNEIDPSAIVQADHYLADSLGQTRRLGELHHAIAAGMVASDASFPELGEVIAGTRTGRLSEKEITIADLTGIGVQGTAIASLAFAKRRSQRPDCPSTAKQTAPYSKHLQLNGSSQGCRAACERVLKYFWVGVINPGFAATYSLSSRFLEAQKLLVSKAFVGNMVVVTDRHYTLRIPTKSPGCTDMKSPGDSETMSPTFPI